MTAGGDSVRNIRRLKEVSDPMEPKRFTLCPACTACSEVEITDQGVTIGEEGNTFGYRTPSGTNSSGALKAATFAKSVVAEQIHQRHHRGESSTASV